MKMHLYITDADKFLAGNLEFSLSVSTRDDLACGTWIAAGPIDIDIDIDELTIRQHAIKQIEQEETNLRAVMNGKLFDLDTRRQRLRALTHQADA